MQRRIFSFIALLICLSLLLAACGGTGAPTSTGESSTGNTAGQSSQNTPQRQSQIPPTAASAAASAESRAAAEGTAADAQAQGGNTSGSTDNQAGGTSATQSEAYAAASTAAAAGAASEQQRAPTTNAAGEPPAAGAAPQPKSAPTQRRPRPAADEPPYDSTYFQNYGVNPFVDAGQDPLSTFAMDVDTASYGVMRRFITDGQLPNPDSVRVEEYLNYFNYQYPQPDAGSNFSIYTESAPSPWGGRGYEMLQVGIQARSIAEEDRAPTSLTFVIDVSGSMAREDRLGTVKQSLSLLVEQMRDDDTIGIIVYGDSAETVLPPTSGSSKRRILNAINQLEPSGSTNVEAGLDVGFAQADEAFLRSGSNMILLCSDGVANNGVTDPQALLDKYERYTSKGIKLATFGFGMGNYNDVLMEQLADAGNGFYSYIDTMDEARRLFVDNLVGTLQLVARDAKIQVEFNPDVVQRYRLVGYENRDVADQDFRNDAVDAGEVGAGHSVTALYEIQRLPESEGDVATVRIRYHKPNNASVIEEAQLVNSRNSARTLDDTSPRFRLAVSVAQYAELLRYSRWARGTVLENVVGTAHTAARQMGNNQDVSEFVRLLDQAAALAPND